MPKHSFLSVQYGDTGFLINKQQFQSSCYFDDGEALNSRIPFLDRSFSYGSEKIRVFDMHAALREIFTLDENGRADLLLIVEFTLFSASIQTYLNDRNDTGPELSNTLLGLRIKSDARIIQLEVDDLRLLPGSMRFYCREMGIIACSFPDEESISYLIDVDNLCASLLFRKQHGGEGL